MGSQMSSGKKEAKHPKYQGYPQQYAIPMPYGAVNPYWPGAGYAPVSMMPQNYAAPGFIPQAFPWPTSHQRPKSKRKRKSSSGRRHRSATGPVANLPAGFVPNGFVPRTRETEDPTRMPHPVVPTSMSRAPSQGQPGPLFTPGNGVGAHLASFPSPQIPTDRAGGGSTHGHGSNRRASTPFVRPQDYEDDESYDSDDDGPVIPNVAPQRGHRRAATNTLPIQVPAYVPPPRRSNPLPQPPRAFDHTPFKRLADLPRLEVPTQTTVVQMIHPTAGLAGIGANGANKDKGKKKSGIFRALSLRGNKQASASAPVTHIVPVIVSNAPVNAGAAVAGPSTATTSNAAWNNPSTPTNPVIPSSSASPAILSTESSPEPPLRFNAMGPYRPLVPFSDHPVTYNGKEYRTAQHLFEAMRFPENRQDCWERIRKGESLSAVYSASSEMVGKGWGRPDWSVIHEQVMEDVMYMKFVQHETIRKLLLETGHAPLVHTASDPHWGAGTNGKGSNRLGELLVRVRDRLRANGFT